MKNKQALKKLAIKSSALALSMSYFLGSVAAFPTIEFDNLDNSERDVISMTDERQFEATLLLEGKTKAEVQQLAKGAKWSLYRLAGSQSEYYFPYQYLGGDISSWTQFDSTNPLFTTSTKVVEENGVYGIKLTLQNKYLFGVDGIDGRNRYNVRNAILDYYGDYTLMCKDANGNVLGTATVEVTPYDSYRTTLDYEREMWEAYEYAKGVDNIYASLRTMGKTTTGAEMYYMVIADSEKSITDYMEFKEYAEKNPTEAIAKIKAGTLDYKIPLLYSNVHADENPGGDAPMNLIWDILKSSENGGKITYQVCTGLTEEGKKQIEKEKEERGIVFTELLADDFTGVGFITADNNGTSGVVDLEKYYTVETVTLDVNELLDNVILLVCPNENVDARTVNQRSNANGFDLNRDNTFQTQVETQNMTKLIAEWNPTVFAEMHGFVSGFQIEPCSPTHGPNFEYDLFIENAVAAGEAFGAAAIANNDQFNSYAMPMRDYFTVNSEGKAQWEYPWDDMSTGYTPQYSMLHGTIAFTIEVPEGNESGTKALEYGLLNNAKFSAENKKELILNQLQVYERGINNVDAEEIRKWYVDEFDNVGAEADIFRPVSDVNNNYFPEYYVIPMDRDNQRNLEAAYDMQAYLLHNDVEVSILKNDTKVNGVTYKAGSIVVDMHQAKRNVANNALAKGTIILGWNDLYSESITAFGDSRGFDYAEIRQVGAFKNKLEEVTTALEAKTSFRGVVGKEVVISNEGTDVIRAVNELLQAGKSVEYYEGDYAISYADFETIKDKYVLTATGVEKAEGTEITKSPKVYITGDNPDFRLKKDGTPFGYRGYDNRTYTNYNWDVFAFTEQLGFVVTENIEEADIIVGNSTITEAEAKYVLEGKPYVAYGVDALYGISDYLLDQSEFDFYHEHPYAIEDALMEVKYVAQDNMITEKYIADNDTIMYGYGGAYLTKVPTNATVLVKSTDTIYQGFLLDEGFENFKNQIQAIEVNKGKMNLVVFANSLTNKAHQTDDYRYITNSIYKMMLKK